MPSYNGYQEVDKNELKVVLRTIQEQYTYQPKPLSPEEIDEKIMRKFSGYEAYSKGFSKTISAIASIGESLEQLSYTEEGQTVGQDFHIVGMALAGLNFIRIPFWYLWAYLLKKENPITLTRNLQWLYASVFLGLSIGSLFFPPLAFFLATIVFIASTFFWGKIAQERRDLERTLKTLDEQIREEENELVMIQSQALNIEEQLRSADDSTIEALSEKIKKLHIRYEDKKTILDGLHSKQIEKQQILDTIISRKIVHRSINLFFASLALMSLAVSVFFPPVGLAMMGAVAVCSGLYLLGRALIPMMRHLWDRSKKTKELMLSESDDSQNEIKLTRLLDATTNLDPSLEKSKEASLHHESTSDILLQIASVQERQELMNKKAQQEQAPLPGSTFDLRASRFGLECEDGDTSDEHLERKK